MSHLAANLAAIRHHFPALAQVLDSTSIPEGFTPAIGNDGTPTFSRVTTTPRRIEWLGHTSMPRASAEAIVSSLDAVSNGNNGLGLSIGTGCEWAAFLQRLGRAQALFVYEPDPAVLRMALDVCDLMEPLTQRRLILLTGPADAAAASLSEFLRTNLGFEPPSVLHPLPSACGGTGEKRNQLLAAGEFIVRRAVQDRQTIVASLFEQLSTSPAAPAIEKRETLAFLLTPRFDGERPIHAQAARDHAHILPIDRHDATSTALRLQTLLQHSRQRPPKILSDLFRAQLNAIPAGASVHTWIPPLNGPAFWDRLPAVETFAPHDRIIVHHQYYVEELRHKKIPETLIELKPLTREVVNSEHSKTVCGKQQKFRIALIADLPPHTAEALGINLPTHQAIFHAATDFVTEDYLAVHPGSAPDILRRALLRANVDPHTTDPAIKDGLLRLIRDVLIPTLPLLTLAKNLHEQNIPSLLIGTWPAPSHPSARHVPFNAYSPETWEEVAILVQFSPQGIVPPLLWHAVNNKIPITAPEHPTDLQKGSLPQLLTPEKQYARARPREFLNYLKSLLKDPTRREQLAAAALASN